MPFEPGRTTRPRKYGEQINVRVDRATTDAIDRMLALNPGIARTELLRMLILRGLRGVAEDGGQTTVTHTLALPPAEGAALGGAA